MDSAPSATAGPPPLENFLRLAEAYAASNFEGGHWHFARLHYERALSRVRTEEGLEPEFKATTLDRLQNMANYLFTLEQVAPEPDKIPTGQLQKLLDQVRHQSPSELADFRRRIENGNALPGPAQEALTLGQPDVAGESPVTRPAQIPVPPQTPAPSGDSDEESHFHDDDTDDLPVVGVD